jgi:hypothetical protein
MSHLNRRSFDSTTFILGSGFSKCSGLPIQSEFSKFMLADKFDSNIDKEITIILKDFLANVFGWEKRKELPSLEDIFTCIDLSASSGHNLGFHYEPRHLRSLRRLLINRVFSVLDDFYEPSPEIKELLRLIYKSPNLDDRCNFVVLNWDIVLEKHLRDLDRHCRINYCTPCYDWINLSSQQDSSGVPVCKMHGSSNWVYCDNCKSLFYKLDEKLPLRIKAGLNKSDFDIFDRIIGDEQFCAEIGRCDEARKCRFCGNKVSTHIASFSYRKSFRTSAYSSIWYHAERLLAKSDHWVFIGYSLPEADYEFKHLLKSAQLRKSNPEKSISKRIEVVTKDKTTCKKFRKFFGEKAICKCYNKGLSQYVSDKDDNVDLG